MVSTSNFVTIVSVLVGMVVGGAVTGVPPKRSKSPPADVEGGGTVVGPTSRPRRSINAAPPEEVGGACVIMGGAVPPSRSRRSDC